MTRSSFRAGCFSLVAVLLAVAALVAVCVFRGRHAVPQPAQESQIRAVMAAWQSHVLAGDAGATAACFAPDVDRYLQSRQGPAMAPLSTDHPQVDRIVQGAIARCIPESRQAIVPSAEILKRVFQRHLIRPRDVQNLGLGDIAVTGDHATGDLLWQGHSLALSLDFVRLDGQWKIDLLPLLPYAELLLQVERTFKAESEDTQVARIVQPLPIL